MFHVSCKTTLLATMRSVAALALVAGASAFAPMMSMDMGRRQVGTPPAHLVSRALAACGPLRVTGLCFGCCPRCHRFVTGHLFLTHHLCCRARPALLSRSCRLRAPPPWLPPSSDPRRRMPSSRTSLSPPASSRASSRALPSSRFSTTVAAPARYESVVCFFAAALLVARAGMVALR